MDGLKNERETDNNEESEMEIESHNRQCRIKMK